MADLTIEKVTKFFKDIRPITLRIIADWMKENEQWVEDQIRDQLSKGKDAKDKVIQRGYSPGYAERRKRRGLQTSFVDLKFTGEFYKSIELMDTPKDNKFILTSQDEKAISLFKRYGRQIVELNDKNVQELKKRLKKAIIKEYNRIL